MDADPDPRPGARHRHRLRRSDQGADIDASTEMNEEQRNREALAEADELLSDAAGLTEQRNDRPDGEAGDQDGRAEATRQPRTDEKGQQRHAQIEPPAPLVRHHPQPLRPGLSAYRP